MRGVLFSLIASDIAPSSSAQIRFQNLLQGFPWKGVREDPTLCFQTTPLHSPNSRETKWMMFWPGGVNGQFPPLSLNVSGWCSLMSLLPWHLIFIIDCLSPHPCCSLIDQRNERRCEMRRNIYDQFAQYFLPRGSLLIKTGIDWRPLLFLNLPNPLSPSLISSYPPPPALLLPFHAVSASRWLMYPAKYWKERGGANRFSRISRLSSIRPLFRRAVNMAILMFHKHLPVYSWRVVDSPLNPFLSFLPRFRCISPCLRFLTRSFHGG